MLLDKFQYLLGDTGVGTDVAAIHLPIAQLFHLCILGWHDANGDLRRLAQVRTIECNRRNRPTPQSLPGFFSQAFKEPILHHHIAPSATVTRTRPLKRQVAVEDVDSIEVELGVEAALDVVGLAKPMLLAGEQKVADMSALAAERLNHRLRLVRWHDRVLVALEEDNGLRQPVRMMDRRALAVARLLL